MYKQFLCQKRWREETARHLIFYRISSRLCPSTDINYRIGRINQIFDLIIPTEVEIINRYGVACRICSQEELQIIAYQ